MILLVEGIPVQLQSCPMDKYIDWITDMYRAYCGSENFYSLCSFVAHKEGWTERRELSWNDFYNEYYEEFGDQAVSLDKRPLSEIPKILYTIIQKIL